MRTRLTLLCAFCLHLLLSAQYPMAGESSQKFIYHNDPSGLILIESIEPGMTLFGLARKYNISMDSILQSNPDLNPEAIPLGYPVNIPIYTRAIIFEPPHDSIVNLPIYYRVQPKETLYRISRVYLQATPEALVRLNPRIDQGLAIGQVLHLGWYVPGLNTHSPAEATAMHEGIAELYTVKDFNKEYKSEGKIIREQKGLAVWKPGSVQSHYYVLHPSAKVGSYMEITNPMLHRTLTAKVAGNIPPGLYQTHVGLVVSPSVARALGVLDQQFFAQWRYVE